MREREVVLICTVMASPVPRLGVERGHSLFLISVGIYIKGLYLPFGSMQNRLGGGEWLDESLRWSRCRSVCVGGAGSVSSLPVS